MKDYEIDHMRGCDIIDPRGDKAGKLQDVIFDEHTMTPRWAVVQYGLTHHRTLVPVSKVYRTDDGNLATSIEKEAIKTAPKVHGDALPTHECEAYYASDAE